MNKKLAGFFGNVRSVADWMSGSRKRAARKLRRRIPDGKRWMSLPTGIWIRTRPEIFSETNSAAAIAVDTEATVFGEQTSRVMFQFINLDQTGVMENQYCAK